MSADANPRGTEEHFWERLFADDEKSKEKSAIGMRLVRKRGRPFLLLPAEARLATCVLELYPAQTWKAKIAVALLRAALWTHLPIGQQTISLPLSTENAFVKFLAGLANQAERTIPAFGILAGNPNSLGQRFIFLIFNVSGKPAAVVKTGVGARPRELIRREKIFLDSAPNGIPGIPRLRASFETPKAAAFALDFLYGHSPTAADEVGIPNLLSSWIRREGENRVGGTRAWRELEETCPAHPLFSAVNQRLKDKTVCAAIYHGDFAPWNIKISPSGSWTVLDWERGDSNGLPGWDWLHYVIQSASLVKRLSPQAMALRVEGLLNSDDFLNYARATGIAGRERDWTLGYLLYCRHVIVPSEGLSRIGELLEILAAKWRPS